MGLAVFTLAFAGHVTADRIGDWRHSLAYPTDISAVGSVSEKKARLEPYQNIPLLITPKTRDDYLQSAESKEKTLRGFGLILLLVGTTAVFYGLWDHTSWPMPTHHRFQWPTLGAAFLPALAIFTPFWALHVYNSFVTYSVRADNAWRQVDVDLKMRYDLIPQLVSVTKAYLKHERNLLERIAALRAEAAGGDAAKKIGVEGIMVQGLQKLAAVVEKYPELGSQPMTAKLMRELTALAEKIAHGRTVYNEAATEYNNNVQSFPRVLIAGRCGFTPRPLFDALGSKREAQTITTESAQEESDGSPNPR